MRIDPKVEDATRAMLDDVLKDKLDEIPKVAATIGEERFLECLRLCVAIAGYVTVDVVAPGWPTDASLRELAQRAAQARIPVELDPSQVYDYLRISAVGFRSLDQVFSSDAEKAVMPIAMTAALVLAFHAKGRSVWEYLDDVEEALEAASSVKPSMLPAMILRAHEIEASKAR